MQKVNLSAEENSRKEKSHKFDNKTAKVLLIVILFLAVFLFAEQVLAQTQDITGLSYVQSSGLGNQDIRVTIAKLIRIFFGLLGIIAVVIILYGGFLYMTSAGEVEKIKTAKKVLTGAVIGLIICLSAFGIAQFVITSILGGGGGEGGPVGPSPYGYGGGALGAGIIESHYPARGETNVSRKTKIIVTFKEPMCVATLITGTKINTTNIKIYPTATGSATAVQDVEAGVTPDGKTFSFRPVNLLGSPDVMMNYTVDLGTGLQKSNCSTAAFGAFKSYSWNFTVSTIVDNTPPQIQSVVPYPADTVFRNNIVQINFNEAIDPMTLRGTVLLDGGSTVTRGSLHKTGGVIDTYNYINVCAEATCLETSTNILAGEFRYSNQYRTVEFITNDLCGKNSCGGDVFCLPGNSPISVLIKAATLVKAGENTAAFPYTGLVDMSDNSFDGNKNGASNGPGAVAYNLLSTAANTGASDNAFWSFTTNNQIDLDPPLITSIVPTANALLVGPDSKFSILFNKIMMSSTLKPNGNYAMDKDYSKLMTGLLGYYRFTTSAIDESGKGNNGTIVGTATITDGELNVTGSNSYVSTQLKVVQTSGSTATFCAWANLRSVTNTQGNDVISTDNAGFDWAIDAVPPGYWRLATGSTYWSANSKFPVKLNQWQHVCGVFDTNNVYLYIDNVVVALGSAPGYDSSVNFFTIGNNPSYISENFDGKIDSVLVYNRALSQAEIAGLYDLGKDGDLALKVQQSIAAMPADIKNYITLLQPLIPSGQESGYWISQTEDLSDATRKTKAEIQTTGLGENIKYGLRVSSDVLDINQNCFMPCAGPGCSREAVPGGKPGEYQQGTPTWPGGKYPTCDLLQ